MNSCTFWPDRWGSYDHPDIRKLFAGWPVVEIDHKYTVGGGGAGKNCVELVYGTWSDGVPKPRATQQGLF